MALANTTQYAGDVQVRLAPFYYFLPFTIICTLFHALTSLVLQFVQLSTGQFKDSVFSYNFEQF